MVQSIAKAQISGHADLITYRYAGKLVYVPPAETYEKAIDWAIEAFPNLANEPREQICFGIGVVVSGQQNKVRISKLAWTAISGSLERFEIVDVDVDRTLPSMEKSAPVPEYSAPPQYDQQAGHAAGFHGAPSGGESVGSIKRLLGLFSCKA